MSNNNFEDDFINITIDDISDIKNTIITPQDHFFQSLPPDIQRMIYSKVVEHSNIEMKKTLKNLVTKNK